MKPSKGTFFIAVMIFISMTTMTSAQLENPITSSLAAIHQKATLTVKCEYDTEVFESTASGITGNTTSSFKEINKERSDANEHIYDLVGVERDTVLSVKCKNMDSSIYGNFEAILDYLGTSYTMNVSEPWTITTAQFTFASVFPTASPTKLPTSFPTITPFWTLFRNMVSNIHGFSYNMTDLLKAQAEAYYKNAKVGSTDVFVTNTWESWEDFESRMDRSCAAEEYLSKRDKCLLADSVLSGCGMIAECKSFKDEVKMNLESMLLHCGLSHLNDATFIECDVFTSFWNEVDRITGVESTDLDALKQHTKMQFATLYEAIVEYEWSDVREALRTASCTNQEGKVCIFVNSLLGGCKNEDSKYRCQKSDMDSQADATKNIESILEAVLTQHCPNQTPYA